MKKYLSLKKAALILFAALMIPAALTGCGEEAKTGSSAPQSSQQESVDPELQKLMDDAKTLTDACKEVYTAVFTGTLTNTEPCAIDPAKLPDPSAGEKTRRDIAFNLTVGDVIAYKGLSSLESEIPQFVVDYRSGRIYAKDEPEAKGRGLDPFTTESDLGWLLFGQGTY